MPRLTHEVGPSRFKASLETIRQILCLALRLGQHHLLPVALVGRYFPPQSDWGYGCTSFARAAFSPLMTEAPCLDRQGAFFCLARFLSIALLGDASLKPLRSEATGQKFDEQPRPGGQMRRMCP
jgi:hypothetical protein